jgi:peptidoglycan/LPS O-acetylase OafA/YrhL
VKTRLGGIQALRALAALAVVVQHANYYVATQLGIPWTTHLPTDIGTPAVILFFVISGFVMGRCLDQGRAFLWRRFVRIYPPFWMAIALSWLLLAWTSPGWYFSWGSAFLLPVRGLNQSWLIPFWTLCYEVAFYAAVYAFILAGFGRRRISLICALWLVLIHAITLIRPISIPEPGLAILASPVVPPFVLGLLASTLDLRVSLAMRGALVLAGCAAWFAPLGLGLNGIERLSMAFTCLVLAIGDLPMPAALMWLGDCSYGLYLVHAIGVRVALGGMERFTTIRGYWLTLTVVIGAALALGLTFGAVESRWHRRVARRRREAPHLEHAVAVGDVLPATAAAHRD